MGFHPALWVAIVGEGHARLVARAADNSLHTQLRIGPPLRDVVAPASDPDLRAEPDFAQAVAEALNQADEAGRFAELVLVAPADTLLEIEGTLLPRTRDKIIGTLIADLEHEPDDRLQRHLAEWVGPLIRGA
jgi:protein required for attachment to host cells